MPEKKVINIALRLTGVVLTENYTKRTSIISSSAITISKTSRLSIDPQLSRIKKYGIQGQSTMVEIDSSLFKILLYIKSLYFYIMSKKVWKDSQNIIELYSEYGILA